MDEKFLDGFVSDSVSTSKRSQDRIFQTENTRTQFDRQSPITSFKSKDTQNIFNKKLVNLKEAGKTRENFEGDDPAKIYSGMQVEHQRFGVGKVLKVEGVPPNLKATVFFQNAGHKQLLLKFAKLKIIS